MSPTQAFSWGLCRTIVYAFVVYFTWIRITVGLTMNLILSPIVVVASIVRMMGETSSWPLSIMGHWSWVKTEYAREFLMNEMPENFRIELFNRHTIKWNINKCFLLLLLCSKLSSSLWAPPERLCQQGVLVQPTVGKYLQVMQAGDASKWGLGCFLKLRQSQSPPPT